MKKLNLVFVISLCLLKINCNAQAIFDWALNCGGALTGTSADEARVVKTDNSGNVYVAGSFYGTADFDPGPGTQIITSAGSGDGYIAKYDANGNFLAVYTFTNNLDCKVYSIDIDNAGNIVAVGNFIGTVDFDPSAGFYGLSSPSSYDFFVLKLNAVGAFAWAIKIGSSGADDNALSVCTDASSNVLVTGSFNGSADFDPGIGITNLSSSNYDAFVLKLTSVGVFSWAFNIGGAGASDRGNAIHVDPANNVFLGGYYQGTADFDPNAGTAILTSTGAQSGYLAKYSALGSFVWVKQFDGAGASSINDFNLSATGEIYAAGSFTGTIDADAGTGTTNISSLALNDIFVTKINNLGNFAWVNQVGGIGDDAPTSIATDASGVYFAGYFSNIVDFDAGSVGTYTIASNGAKDFFVSKIDLNSNHLFSYGIGNSASNEIGFSITTPSNNLIYVAGTFSGTVDFNPYSFGVNNFTSTGGYDAFLLKLKPCTQTISLTASSTTLCAGSNATLAASGTNNSYTWSTGATSSVVIVTPTISTTYSVTGYFLTTGCTDTKTVDVQVLGCNGLHEFSYTQADYLVYPNPNSGSFILRAEQSGTYKLTNILGEVVKVFEISDIATQIYLNNLSSGIYYLNYKQTSKKIIIN
ncbi:MAG: T9SS type A sorting domain-containing protein [Bacteroidia bacterium]|nr:T9SS type A sorting domain-containing protein [Bacteroidia bacterium]